MDDESTASLDTIDHFTVYATTDGSDLTLVADDIANSATSTDLSQYNVPSGAKYYLKMVGVHSIVNQMSPISD